jgi:hypothetical protein
MGASLSWFAVKADRGAVLEALGVEPAGAVDLPRRWGVGDLPDGWVILLFERDLKGAFEPRCAVLSTLGPAIACAVEEHVMFQEARGYAGGRETWRVVHDSEKGIFHLDVSGDPPAALETLRREAVAEQKAEGGEDADVDLIADVPLLLAQGICGFKHDEAWPASLAFEELRKARSQDEGQKGPGFFQRLFGRR